MPFFFGGRQQRNGLKPDVQFNVAGLEYGADLNAELFTAGVAFVNANTGALAFHFRTTIHNPAMRTRAAFGPSARLKIFVGGGFIMEMLGG
jgi:hypothetical protein